MKAVPAVRLALFLLLPLAAWPGAADDVLRLPLALLLAATLAVPPLPAPGPAFGALAAFVLLQAIRVAPGAWEADGLVAVLVGALGISAMAAARAAPDRRAVPWLLCALGLGTGVAAAFSRAGLEGNPNYAGAVAGLLVPALAALAAGVGGRLRVAALAGLGGAAFALLASESRGGLLAALAGLLVVGVLLAKRSGPRAVLVPALLAVILVAEPLLFRAARYASSDRTDTASVRLEVWKGAGRMGLDRPLGGVGAGGFAVEFPAYRNAAEAALTQRDALPGEFREVEDAHSTWMQVLAELGFPGLLLLLGAVGFAGRAVVRSVRAPNAGALEAGLAGLAAAFVVAATFNDLHARLSPWLLFWIAVGLVEKPAEKDRAQRLILASLLAAAPALALFVWPSILASDLRYPAALEARFPADRKRLLEGVTAGPRAWKARFLRGADALGAGRLEEAEGHFDAVLRARPRHAAAGVNVAVIRLRRGESPALVEQRLLAVRASAPHYFGTEYNLANLSVILGRPAEARERYRAAQALHPRHAGSAYGEGAAWLAEGKVDDALPALRRARELGMDVGIALRGDFPALSGEPRLAEFFR